MKEIIAGVPLAQYAAVTAALAEAFPLRAVLSIEGLDPARWAEADRGWTAQLDEDPALLARYESELAAAQERLHTREDAAPRDEGAAKLPPSRAAKARLIRSGTGLAEPQAIPVPVAFSAPAPPPPAPAARPATSRPPAPARELDGPRLPQISDDEGTLTAFNVPGPLLPFQAAPAPQANHARPPDVSEPRPPLPASDDESTRAIFAVPKEFLPFKAWPSREDSAPLPRIAEPDESDDDEVGTVATYKPPGELLPFGATPSREFQEALERPAAAEGQGSDGSTVAVRGVDALRALSIPDAPPLPWGPPPAPKAERRRPPPPPVPKGKARPQPAPSAPPPMSLQRHASLCLEIAVDPAHAGEALARYQVSVADKARADEYYRARIAADPELRAEWNHAYAVYHAWFTSRPRP